MNHSLKGNQAVQEQQRIKKICLDLAGEASCVSFLLAEKKSSEINNRVEDFITKVGNVLPSLDRYKTTKSKPLNFGYSRIDADIKGFDRLAASSFLVFNTVVKYGTDYEDSKSVLNRFTWDLELAVQCFKYKPTDEDVHADA